MNSTKKILITDHNLFLFDVYVRSLEKYNYQIVLVKSHREFLNKVKRQKFDLIILDLDIPEMNGVETIERLRDYDNGKSVSIIGLSKSTLSDLRIKELEKFGVILLSKWTTSPSDLSQRVAQIIKS